MNCEQARERLLDADLDELRRSTQTPLSRHLQDCDDCRGMARLLIDSHRQLAQTLDHSTSKPSRTRVRRWPRAAALATAAGLAVFFAWPRSSDRMPASTPEPVRVDVTAPTGRRVAVFTTSNPNIKVVWFFD